MASHCSENKLQASNKASKDPSPPLQALITYSLTLAHAAPATLTAFSFLQHIKVISASGPLHLLFSLLGVHFSLIFIWQPLSAPVRSLLKCHFREADLWSHLVWRSTPLSLTLTLLIPSKHLAPSEVMWFDHFLVY